MIVVGDDEFWNRNVIDDVKKRFINNNNKILIILMVLEPVFQKIQPQRKKIY